MKKLISLFGILFLVGCATNTTYYWGNYERLVYEMYKNPGKSTPDQQLNTLRKDVEIASNKGKPVPPGVFAHMGMLYASIGDKEQAKLALKEEMARYPESTAFINGMLKQLDKGNP